MGSRCLSLSVVLSVALGVLSPTSAAMAETGSEAEAPNLALLEFLGSWEGPDGEWVDPLQVLDELEDEGAKGTKSRESTKNRESAPAPEKEEKND